MLAASSWLMDSPVPSSQLRESRNSCLDAIHLSNAAASHVESRSPLVSRTTVPEAPASFFLVQPQPVHQASMFTAVSQVLPASTVALLGAGCWAGLGKILFSKSSDILVHIPWIDYDYRKATYFT